MTTLYPAQPCIYDIDELDNLCFVNAEWTAFAERNEGVNLSEANVLGKSLWSYIEGQALQQVYREILYHARRQRLTVTLLSRCDSPDLYRKIELKIAPLDGSRLRFECVILSERRRPPLDILKRSVKRTPEIQVICSICKRLRMEAGHWQDLEAAVNELQLLNRDSCPHLSHGLCPVCAADQNLLLAKLTNATS